MVFTSWVFLKFFAVVLAGLWLLPTRTLRQLLILVASIYFYAYWKPSYIFVLATPSIIDYFCAIRIAESDDAVIRKRWLWISMATNLGLLAYFKYTNFFIENIASLFGMEAQHLNIVLPIGISFYTFKTMSYTIDVYRREIPVCRGLWQYVMFVTYFPELVAGPIVRASVFLPQMGRSLRPSWPRAIIGFQVVLLGITKKIVIADRLAIFVDSVFASPQAFSPATMISAVVAYSLQIYCDFSGYSDIAIGVSKIIGFDLPENFNMPYLATSVTEFWHRWHLTLSRWLRDYLYIPLGGNRKGQLRTYINLMLTMLLGGLWHGASWNFVLWGLLHGIGLALHKWWLEVRGERRKNTRSRFRLIVCWLGTYIFVCITWIFFRANNFTTSIIVLRKVFYIDTGGIAWFYLPLFLLLPVVVLGHVFGALANRRAHAGESRLRFITPPSWVRYFYEGRFAIKPSKAAGIYVLLPLPGFAGTFILVLWVLGIYLYANLNTSPFIYFQF
ncbi:MAG: MBOAT family protein [Pyrinomonadaceae bacterium]